ncbi:MAG: peptidase [Proteobacteria bacterium SG_bin5]|nr:TIGR02281 family clan AA aspartic protease [Sphingomonas sp.]OQW40502.1 MAG: peptidase [Proteobacteria bacterium SG_bin5]
MNVIPELSGHWPLIAAVVAGFVLLRLLRRVPVLGTLISLASWGVAVVLLVVVLDQRQRFDPYLARLSQALGIEGQRVEGRELRVEMAPDGHFWVRARIGGVERRLLVDSGATITALAPDTAAAAGLAPSDALFPVVLRTANGAVRAQTAQVPELRLGNIVARDLPVVVSPAFQGVNVLGMNFLSRLKSWRVEGRTLILVPHHPQPQA